MKIFKKNPKAFSLVEISVVVIIVGLLIAGVTSGARLIDESRLKIARTLTENSRVNSMEGLVVWYETSLKKSFSKTDAVDGRTVSQWNDINPQDSGLHARAGQKTDTTQITYSLAPGVTEADNVSGPTYVEDGINHIPTLSFNSESNSIQYLSTDKQMTSNPSDSMTMFYVMKSTDEDGLGWPIGKSCFEESVGAVHCHTSEKVGLFGHVIILGGLYLQLGKDNDEDFPSCPGGLCDTGHKMVTGKSYIITLQRDYGNSFVTYINGSSSYHANSTKADDGGYLTLNPLKIGNDGHEAGTLDTEISEIILFSGAIKKRDREEVEEYLGKKYDIPVSHQ